MFPQNFLLRTLQQRNGRKTPPVQPGTQGKQGKCPGVAPFFFSELCRKGIWNGRIFLVEGVIALIYRFSFSHHFRHQSHASSVQRRSMQIETGDSKPLGKQGIFINVLLQSVLSSHPIQQTRLFVSYRKTSTWSSNNILALLYQQWLVRKQVQNIVCIRLNSMSIYIFCVK